MRIHSTFIRQGCQISSVGQGGQAGEVGQTDQVCPIGEGGACSLVGPGWGGGGGLCGLGDPGGLCGQVVNLVQVVQVVRVVRVIQVVQLVKGVSIDDMHSENIWYTWSKPSDYWEKLRIVDIATRVIRDVGPGRFSLGGGWSQHWASQLSSFFKRRHRPAASWQEEQCR